MSGVVTGREQFSYCWSDILQAQCPSPTNGIKALEVVHRDNIFWASLTVLTTA